MPTVGTTAICALTARAADPASFELHAASGNTDLIKYNMTGDNGVLNDVGELLAGQSIIVSGFVGQVYVLAKSGTQTYGIPILQFNSVTGTAAEILK